MVEEDMLKKQNQHLSILGSSITQIKDIAGQIKQSMQTDEGIVDGLESGFNRNKRMIA